MSENIVDTHFHMWALQKFQYAWPNADDKSLKKIYRDFVMKDYEEEMRKTPITHAVFVEVHESVEETEWVLGIAENSFIKGVVGFVDLTSSRVEEDVKRLKCNRKFVGVRKILDLSEEGWIERDDVIRGMEVLARHSLTYDLLIRTRAQYESAKRFLKRAPSTLRIVIDHLGKPNAKIGADQPWYDDIVTFASYPNVSCKLSGMVTEADLDNWKPSDFKQHVDHVIKHFGINRVMFGSDWPVCKLANANLADVLKLLNELLKDRSVDERRLVFGDNAIQFYNLQL